MAKYKLRFKGSQVDNGIDFAVNSDAQPTENSEKGSKSGGIWSAIQAAIGLIPTALSQLADDATHRLVSDTEKQTWNGKSDFSGSYTDLTNKPTIPSQLSQLSDDATHRLVTDTEKGTWNGKQNALQFMTTPSSTNKVATATDLSAAAGNKYCQAKSDGTFINKGFTINTSVPRTVTVPANITMVKITVTAYANRNQGGFPVTKNGTTILSPVNMYYGEQTVCASGVFDVVQGDVLLLNTTVTSTMVVEELK